MKTTLTARRLLTDIGQVEWPVIEVDEAGCISDISSDPIALSGETTTLTSAFFDVHTHGAVGVDVMSASSADMARLCSFYAARGVAYFLPTTATASRETTLRTLASLADAIEAGPQAAQAQPLGIHLEGPFLSHLRRGVHPEALLEPPSIALFDDFWQASRGHIALMTLAPETPGALALIRHATALGVRISLGHSNATAAETQAAINAGAVSATHTFNAMRPLDHREPGILGTVLDTPSLYAEMICDGVHVSPPMVRLWYRSKAATQRAVLVTDSMSATGMPEGSYTLAGLPVSVVGGRATLTDSPTTLAGSVLTLDAAVANLQHFTGCSLGEATLCAAHSPAALMGRPELTRAVAGGPASFNRFDEQHRLIATYLRGASVRD
jgi:N-acetylglucosamine-6-phosphate deacetylase